MQEESYKHFLRPEEIQVESLENNHFRVVLEPLERGYGHTLGNALRRIMISSMPGVAVEEVTIQGVLHEYTSMEGVHMRKIPRGTEPHSRISGC